MSTTPDRFKQRARSDSSAVFAAVRRSRAYRAVTGAWLDPVLLACSGGVDSMALLVAGAAARAAGRVGPVIVVHVDHRTRRETRAESALVARQSARFGVPFVSVVVAGDTGNSSPGGLEAQLRMQRYECLARLAASLGVAAVVTAHTRDDQVETVLMRLLSGSSPLASAGMRTKIVLSTAAGNLQVLRPLLDVSRSELAEVLVRSGTPHSEDPSNLDRRFRRNALRHDVIPRLEEIVPGFGGALLRTVELARRDAETVDGLAEHVFQEIVTCVPAQCVIIRATLRNQDTAVASRVVLKAARMLVPEDTRELSLERIEAVLAAVNGRVGALIELPYGLRARIERDRLLIQRVEAVEEAS